MRKCQSYFMRLLSCKTDGPTSMAWICWNLTPLFVNVCFFVVKEKAYWSNVIRSLREFSVEVYRIFISTNGWCEKLLRKAQGVRCRWKTLCRWDINSKADKKMNGALKDCNVKVRLRSSSPAGFANRNSYTLVCTKSVEFTDQLRRYTFSRNNV